MQSTVDHGVIRRWAEQRDAAPAVVAASAPAGEPGTLRLDFPGYTGADSVEHISWERFFEWFEEGRLEFHYQETTEGGDLSHFFKLVPREG